MKNLLKTVRQTIEVLSKIKSFQIVHSDGVMEFYKEKDTWIIGDSCRWEGTSWQIAKDVTPKRLANMLFRSHFTNALKISITHS